MHVLLEPLFLVRINRQYSEIVINSKTLVVTYNGGFVVEKSEEWI